MVIKKKIELDKDVKVAIDLFAETRAKQNAYLKGIGWKPLPEVVPASKPEPPKHPLTQSDFRANSTSASRNWKKNLAGECHPNEGVDATYFNGGRLELSCHVCKKNLGSVLVADNRYDARELEGLRTRPKMYAVTREAFVNQVGACLDHLGISGMGLFMKVLSVPGNPNEVDQSSCAEAVTQEFVDKVMKVADRMILSAGKA